MQKTILVINLFFICLTLTRALGADQKQHFPDFADQNTVALWLFDETQYPFTTLTDAGPFEYDLRLMPGGELVKGKYGNALKVSGDMGYIVSYAGFKGAVPLHTMRGEDGEPSGLWGPTVAPEKILNTLQSKDWTLEFWLLLDSPSAERMTLLDIGDRLYPGFELLLVKKDESFVVINSYSGIRAECPTDLNQLNNGEWHHVRFTWSAAEQSLIHRLDGKTQGDPVITIVEKTKLPEAVWPKEIDKGFGEFTADKTLDWRRHNRFNISIGQNRQGGNSIAGRVDELHISDVIRTFKDTDEIESLSRNYSSDPPAVAKAHGLAPLFSPDHSSLPIQLGSRKHLFIDKALIKAHENIKLTVNSPARRDMTDIDVKNASWRPSVLDHDGSVYMYIPDSYGSSEGLTHLKISDDGIHFHDPELGVVEYQGSTRNNLVFKQTPFYGNFFIDTNPRVSQSGKFKLTAWVANRGIYMYMSPDGIHWRRNETIMLPLVSGGEAETFFDNQHGRYLTFLKADASYPGGEGRRAVLFQTDEINKPWPFNPLEQPYYEGWPFPAVTSEGPVAFPKTEYGQVYRTRALKYPWAPDTYLAFVWRFNQQENRKIELAVSRDGVNWNFYADKGWYVAPFGTYEETLSLYGMIRRGDEIWQYEEYGTGSHGDGERVYARLTQRLDGFVSLDADNSPGTILTHPVVFQGNKLKLNVAAENGYIRVALFNKQGKPISGYTFEDCDPVQTDEIAHVVTWQGKPDLSRLAGKVVQLKIKLKQAKLYAIQFSD